MRSLIVVPFLLITTLAATRSPAHACSIAANPEFQVDLNEVGVDKTAPGAIVEVRADVTRGQASACGGGSSSCDDLGFVRLEITPGTDDRTAAQDLGYRVTLVKGRLPNGLTLPADPIRLDAGDLHFVWVDGASDSQEGVSFTLAVIPIDAAGNEGPAFEVRVSDPGSGCSAGRAELPLWVAVALVLVRVRRRVTAGA